jgi:hypothetical protein
MAAKLKIEKRGDKILIVHCCFNISQNELKFELQESFQQSLVEIGSVVSEEKIFFKFHPPFFLICIIGQNRQKFKVHKNPVIHVKKLIIMLIQFKFGHILA